MKVLVVNLLHVFRVPRPLIVRGQSAPKEMRSSRLRTNRIHGCATVVETM